MFHWQILKTALSSLRLNFLRSLLATVGVIIGVGAVVSAISILEGARREILDQFESLGADRIMIFNGSERRMQRSVIANSLVPDDAQKILDENEGLILATAPQFGRSGQVKFLSSNVYATILGTTDSFAPMNEYVAVEGRFLTRQDVRGGAMVCVLGHQVAEELFGALPCVGESVKIEGKGFTVVGRMEEKGAIGMTEVDSFVFAPLPTVMDKLFGGRYLNALVAQCVDSKRLPVCIDGIKKTLRASHRIKAGDDDDFQIYSQEQIKQNFAQAASIFAVVLYSIAGISLVVGGIGIMNIMLVSVTERTREIGVRIAVGARRWDIARQFLIEAGVISLLGGGLGALVGWALANFLGEFTQVIQTYTSSGTVFMALIMAGMVGIISGLYPAVRAANLDPIRALRYE